METPNASISHALSRLTAAKVHATAAREALLTIRGESSLHAQAYFLALSAEGHAADAERVAREVVESLKPKELPA